MYFGASFFLRVIRHITKHRCAFMSSVVKKLYSSNNYCNQTCVYNIVYINPLRRNLAAQRWLQKNTDQVAESV